MKKTISIILVSLLASPLFVFASCMGDAYEEDVTTSNGSVMSECKCAIGSTGEYPDCECPSGTAMSGKTCVSTAGGGSNCSACTAVGVPCDSNGNCICPSGTAWTGSSCYSCGVNIPGQGTFCGSGCAGYGGCSSDSGGDDPSDDDDPSGGGISGGDVPGESSGGITNPISANTFAELVELVTKWIIDIALVLAPLIIVYGGFTYITAAGEPAKMESGKKIILYAVIGFILVLLAVSLVGVLTDLAK
jgi:hypothetical protein